MRILVSLMVILVLLPTVEAQSDLPSYEPAACIFDVPSGESAECGYVTVLENRNQPDGNTIRLYVAHFHSRRSNAPTDPIVYLVGGPGVSALYDIDLLFSHFEPLLDNRDVIVLDQRGTGFSEPALDCGDEGSADPICRNDLVSQGVQLEAYNSTESAADIEDVRVALGLDQINLVGVSYGSRLALTMARDYPEGVRSVVIDSVLPLEFPVRRASAVDYINLVITDCEEDEVCSQAYPDLRHVHEQNIDRLNFRALSIFGSPRFNGGQYIQQLGRLIWRTDLAWRIPRVIYDVARGDYSDLSIDPLAGIHTFEGMATAVLCNDEHNTNSYCRAWGGGTYPALDAKPLITDVPTLILSGRYDARTPTEWAMDVDSELTYSALYEFEYLSHGVIRSGGDCPQSMAYAFLDEPTKLPDASCMEEMQPQFFYDVFEVGS